MSILTRFKSWLKEEVKIDYESIAVDVKGLAEHIEGEFSEVDKKFTGVIDGVKKNYDSIVSDLQNQLTHVVQLAEDTAKRLTDHIGSQAAIGVAATVPNPPVVPVVTDSSAQSASTDTTVEATGTPAAAVTTNNAA